MVAIKGMEMPSCCADCNMTTCKGEDAPWNYVCSINLKDIDFNKTDRAEHCPLTEIVTCKDCKHCYPDEDGRGYHCERDSNVRFSVYEDFWCANGERSE